MRGESAHASESTIKYLSPSSSDFDSVLILLTALACCNTYWSKHGQSNIVVLLNPRERTQENTELQILEAVGPAGKSASTEQQEVLKGSFWSWFFLGVDPCCLFILSQLILPMLSRYSTDRQVVRAKICWTHQQEQGKRPEVGKQCRIYF